MITYKQMKERQKDDLAHNRITYSIHRKVSTIFAYMFIKCNITANQVTLFNCIVPIIGYLFLVQRNYLNVVVGLLFFILFRVLDDADGEIARNTNKESLNGLFLDGIQDYIYLVCLGVGLGMYINPFLIFPLTLILITEYSIGQIWIRILLGFSINKGIKINIKEKSNSIATPQSKNIFLKIFNVYPAGLFFSIEFISPILIVMILLGVAMGLQLALAYIILLMAIKFFGMLILIWKTFEANNNIESEFRV